jgi:hypothetical protein
MIQPPLITGEGFVVTWKEFLENSDIEHLAKNGLEHCYTALEGNPQGDTNIDSVIDILTAIQKKSEKGEQVA